jgi:ATP-dependent Clp protease adaptor protein ClpS
MAATKIEKGSKPKTSRKGKTEPPWNVMLHNDWNNSMPKVIIVLRKVIPGMTFAKATRIMYEAHSTGKSVVKSCHKELAELYVERLQSENLTVDMEKAG